MRVLLAQINPTIGDLAGNTEKILKGIERAQEQKADLVLFPELALSGYPPEDFLLLPHFTKADEPFLEKIIQASQNIAVIVGMPRLNPQGKEKMLCNSAAIIENQKLLGFQDKSLLPTYDVFDERRYFEPGAKSSVWDIKGKRIGVSICEDIWGHAGTVKFTEYTRDPVQDFKEQKPDFVVNLSASPYRVDKFQERAYVCQKAAATLACPILLCNQVGGNDSLIFDGYSLFVNEKAEIAGHAKGFEEDFFLVDLENPANKESIDINETEDLYKALVLGLKDYFSKQGFKKACFGLSGGIDSAVVACIAAEALEKENILAVMMPSRYSSEGSITDSTQLIENLGIKSKKIPIEKTFQSLLDTLEPHFEGKPFDETEENMQARIRGLFLMSLSNKLKYIVLSTGNKSELAMGYATLYGDMVGGLGVISDVTKMQVYDLARWINREKEVIPQNILEKPPTAELKADQKDSDTLPPYDVIDNVLREYVEEHKSPREISTVYSYPLDLVLDLIKRIHRNEYKRRQSAPGLRVSQRAFSVGRRFPIVQKWI